MKFILRLSIAAIILLNGVSHQAKASFGQTSDWQAKVDPWVLQTSAQGETEFLIFLAEQADVSGAANLPTKIEKGRYVLERLNEVAQRTQPSVIAALKKMGVEYRAFRVANMIWARGSQQVIRAIAVRADVARLYANPQVKLDVPATPAISIESDPVAVSTAPQAIEWNITKVNAPQVWAEGFTGQGVVIAGADTGYEWDHPALQNHYRGWNGSTADHDYNWHDAIHSGTGTCGADSPEPCDVYGHGTHTMGTMVGDDGAGNQIGMAPGAKWIGCRNMDNSGYGTPARYLECFEFFLAPYPIGGDPLTQGDPTKAPDVVNNSWTCPSSEGCSWATLQGAVEAVRAAGIVVVAAASNPGSGCSWIVDPPALYDAAFTVGATSSSDNIASFSGRGPITVDGSGRMKPDISAPGVSIRSCTPGPSYELSQGTSMAAPHVAGLVGLLISAAPALRGQVDEIETVIERTAVERPDLTCGGDPSGVPNNTYGWGRIDALAAYNGLHHLSLYKTASAAAIIPGESITYTLTITHTHVLTPTVNVILSDTIPSGTVFLDATWPYSQTANVIEWTFPSLGVNESASVTLTVGTPPTITGTISNAFYGVRSEDVSTVSGDPVVTAVVPYTLTLTKTAPGWVPPGDLLAYQLTVANPHPFAPVHNLVLSDTIPANTIFVAATQPYTLTDQVINWRLSDLAAGSSWGITLTVQSPLTFTGTITNSEYGITSDEFKVLAGPAVRTEIFGLMVDKSAAVVVKPDELLTYTLTVTNLHPSANTYHLVLSDTLPAGTQFVTATLGYIFTGDQVLWNLDQLAAGSAWQVQITVRVNPNAAGTIRNVDYAVRSDEVTPPVAGKPVETLIRREVWLPLLYRIP